MKKVKGSPQSMVAPKSQEQAGKLYLVEDIAGQRALADWMVAGLRQATGWAPGKQVTVAEFDAAVKSFMDRPQGSGKI